MRVLASPHWTDAMPVAPVIIVGAGASGLSAAGALKQRGIDAVLLEQDRQVGEVWTWRYDRLRLHTARELSGLAHYPIPSNYPRYLSRDEFAAYLAEYARHFDLRIETGCTVHKIRQASGDAPGWVATTSEGDWNGRAMIVATGQYGVPKLPTWPGQESFGGELTHSAQYTTGSVYAGQRVLVVGLGNSGAEIATDLVNEGAAFVAVSVRTPPPIVSRDPFGVPVQRISVALSFLPAAVSDRVAQLASRLALGDLTRYGLPQPQWMPYSARRVPVIDVGFVSVLKRGLVHIRPALTGLAPDGAVFADGSTEAFDTIIAATGFDTGLDRLVEAEGALDGAHEPSDLSGESAAHPGLFFMGYVHSLRGHMYETNLASQRLAGVIERYLEETR